MERTDFKTNKMDKFKTWYNLQWREPKRFLYKGFGLTIWKWCQVWFPTWNLHFGRYGHIGYDIFNNGVGFVLKVRNIFYLAICIKGKIGWWYKVGVLRLVVFNKIIEY